MTSTFDLTHDLGFGFSRSNFEIAESQMDGLIDLNHKGSKLIGGWTDYMALTFDHTCDLDLRFSRSNFEIDISQEWEGQLIWSQKDVRCRILYV